MFGDAVDLFSGPVDLFSALVDLFGRTVVWVFLSPTVLQLAGLKSNTKKTIENTPNAKLNQC